MLQSSVISIWNPQNQGYKIGNIYNYWDQPWSPKNGLEMLLRILSANTVNVGKDGGEDSGESVGENTGGVSHHHPPSPIFL